MASFAATRTTQKGCGSKPRQFMIIVCVAMCAPGSALGRVVGAYAGSRELRLHTAYCACMRAARRPPCFFLWPQLNRAPRVGVSSAKTSTFTVYCSAAAQQGVLVLWQLPGGGASAAV